MSTLLDAGVAYAQRGLRVHPLHAGEKRPRWRSWQERATTDATTIRAWWTEHPTDGIGIATGSASGLFVVDLDMKHGHDGIGTFLALEREHGEAPPTWRSMTANGGAHVCFATPLAGTIGNRAGVWGGVDIRGDGGYIVAPPTVLADGKRYAWEIGYAPDELPLATAPAWLVAALDDRPTTGPTRTPDEWAALVRDGVAEGARDTTLTAIVGHLLRRRPSPRLVLELVRAVNEARCRPSLPEADVVRIVDSICGRELRRMRGEV
jgi:hypothetical protein